MIPSNDFLQTGENYVELQDDTMISQYTTMDNTTLYLVYYRWSNRLIYLIKQIINDHSNI